MRNPFRRTPRTRRDIEVAAHLELAGLPTDATVADLITHHQAVGFDIADRCIVPPHALRDPLARIRWGRIKAANP